VVEAADELTKKLLNFFFWQEHVEALRAEEQTKQLKPFLLFLFRLLVLI
jgi:hypothetical protein